MAGRSRAKAYVFDAWSIMAYLQGEPAATDVEALLVEAYRNSIPRLMSVVNIAEVWYALARRGSEARADQRLADISQLGVEYQPADLELALVAAKLKAQYKMSLADCFASALAMRADADLITGDPEFSQVAGDVRIVWLRSK